MALFLSLLSYLVDCGHPGDIDNGNVTVSRTTRYGTARYFCEDGYELQPYQGYTRLCTQLGNWSGDVPSCAGE